MTITKFTCAEKVFQIRVRGGYEFYWNNDKFLSNTYEVWESVGDGYLFRYKLIARSTVDCKRQIKAHEAKLEKVTI